MDTPHCFITARGNILTYGEFHYIINDLNEHGFLPSLLYHSLWIAAINQEFSGIMPGCDRFFSVPRKAFVTWVWLLEDLYQLYSMACDVVDFADENEARIEWDGDNDGHFMQYMEYPVNIGRFIDGMLF